MTMSYKKPRFYAANIKRRRVLQTYLLLTALCKAAYSWAVSVTAAEAKQSVWTKPLQPITEGKQDSLGFLQWLIKLAKQTGFQTLPSLYI